MTPKTRPTRIKQQDSGTTESNFGQLFSPLQRGCIIFIFNRYDKKITIPILIRLVHKTHIQITNGMATLLKFGVAIGIRECKICPSC